MAPSNFSCDSCQQSIPAPDPRAHCLVCTDYDLCATCYLAERFTNDHQGHHRTQVFKKSGGNGRPTVSATDFGCRCPSAATDAPGPSTAPVPPRSPAPATFPTQQSDVPLSMPSPGTTTSKWQPFYNTDFTPTSFYLGLITDIFGFLDPNNTGHLVPEVFSRFLDDMGLNAKENAWKLGLKATAGQSAKSNADKSLKNVFDALSIDHVLLKRAQPPNTDASITSQYARLLGPSVLSDVNKTLAAMEGPMPAITRKGFFQLRKIDGLADPSKEWANMSRVLQKYNLPKYSGFGDLPRSVMPDRPSPVMLKRIADATTLNQLRKAEEQYAVARMSAQMSARHEQDLLDLVDGTRREYRYTYY